MTNYPLSMIFPLALAQFTIVVAKVFNNLLMCGGGSGLFSAIAVHIDMTESNSVVSIATLYLYTHKFALGVGVPVTIKTY